MQGCKYLLSVIVLLSLGLTACKEEPTYNQHEAPKWTTVKADYSETMTAVFRLPSAISTYVQQGDEVAVFYGDECRGSGDLIGSLFFITIVGNASESFPLTIRYYSSRNRYMYEEAGVATFLPNAVLGTADAPYTLTLNVM